MLTRGFSTSGVELSAKPPQKQPKRRNGKRLGIERFILFALRPYFRDGPPFTSTLYCRAIRDYFG
jgi:hypothetical protein